MNLIIFQVSKLRILNKGSPLNSTIDYCGGQNLSFCVGLKVPFTNNNTSEEKKTLGKAP